MFFFGLLFALGSLFAVALFRRWKHFQLFKRIGLPGPPPSILTGNLLDFAKLGANQAFFEWQRFGKTYGYFYGVRPVIVTSDAELLRKVIFKDAHLFYNRAHQFALDVDHDIAGRQVHVTRNSAETKAFRTQFTSAFTSNKLKRVVCTSDESVQTFLSVLKETAIPGEDFEIAQTLRLLAMDSVGRTSFGVAFDLQKTRQVPKVIQQAEEHAMRVLNTRLNAVAVCLPTAVTTPLLRALYAARILGNTIDDLAKTVGSIVDARKQMTTPRFDIMENLIRKEVFGRPMTRAEITANASVAFFAGFDTTAVTLCLVVFRLGRHPEWQEKVREEILREWDDSDLYECLGKLKGLDRFVSECLRLDPPAPAFITREAAEDYEYGNLLIPKGTAVQAAVPLLHRDPSVFPNPDEFNPDHFLENVSPVHYLAFGEGPRNCVGIRFALLQVKLAIVRLVQNYRIRLGKDFETLDCLPQANSGILRRPYGLVVKLEPLSG